MGQTTGRISPMLLLLAASLGLSAAPASAQERVNNGLLRKSLGDAQSSSRLADPNADLIDALGAYDQQTIAAPDEKGKDPSKIRQISDPAEEEAEDEAETAAPPAPAGQSRPRQDFDLLNGPGATRDAGGLARPARPSNAAAAPLGAAEASDETGLEGLFGSKPVDTAGTVDEKDGLPDLANPTLGAGIADETRAARSILRGNTAAETIDSLRRLRRDDADDPFAPVGIRVGTFILYPELIQTVGVSNNIDKDAKATKGAFSETILSTRLLSDWSSNEAEFNSRLAYRKNFAGDAQQNPSAALDGRLRIDISRDTVATLRGAIDYEREDYSDVLDDNALSGRADVFSGSLAATLSHDFRPVSLAGTLTAARRSYSSLPAGSVDEDYTTLTAALRTGYDLSPAVKPFVEASLGRRIFDVPDPIQRDGPSRDAWLPALRAGVTVDLREKLKGEIALGYAWNVPDDGAAAKTGTPTIDASLVWSPQRGTDVTLAGSTSFAPELNGLSATSNYATSLAIAHSLGARTTLTAAASLGYEDSTVEDQDKLLLSGVAGFTYWLNRQFALTGSYEHSRSFAVQPDNRYSADTLKLGVTLQR